MAEKSKSQLYAALSAGADADEVVEKQVTDRYEGVVWKEPETTLLLIKTVVDALAEAGAINLSSKEIAVLFRDVLQKVQRFQ